MEFLKFVRRRTFVSELVYTVLNIALAVAILLIVRYTEAIWFAILLVVISKWRVLAVRPRYWWANIRSNVVDFIVSISVVIHMYNINSSLIPEQKQLLLLLGLTALYIVWLLFIKPRSRRSYVAAQAGIAIFLGVSALFTIAFNWPVSIVVAMMWLIGYSATRHILSSYDNETHSLILGLAWGLVFAEIGWVAYHWAIAYPMPLTGGLLFPQIALITTVISFLAFKTYNSFYHHSKVRMSDVLLPLLFTIAVIAILVLVFNRVGTAI